MSGPSTHPHSNVMSLGTHEYLLSCTVYTESREVMLQGQGYSQRQQSLKIWTAGPRLGKGNPSWFNERSEDILGQVPCLGTTC